MGAVHIVVHDVLKGWHERLLVDEIERDLVISGDLDSNVSLDVVDETSGVDDLVHLPLTSLRDFVLNDLEEEDLTGASANESLVVDKIHLTEISISHPIIKVVVAISGRDDVGESLSVEGVDLIELVIIERLVWEILLRALHHVFAGLTFDSTLGDVVDEVIVGQREVMEQVDEDSFVANKGAGYVRIWESLDSHGPVVDAQQLVDVQLLAIRLFRGPLLLVKPSEPELTIVEVADSVSLTGGVLLDFFDLDIVSISSTDLFFKCHLIRFKIIHLDVVLFLVSLGNGDGSGRVIRNDDRADRVHGRDFSSLEEVFEQLSVILESGIWLDFNRLALRILILIFNVFRGTLVVFIVLFL